MNFIICDDDEKDITKLRNMIEEYGRQHAMEIHICEFGSGKELLEAMSKEIDKDAIFLDINMDDMDGLSVAKLIRENDEEVPIVLVTAYMNYALDGYKVRASRFLIKDDLDKTFTECMDSICHEKKRQSDKILFSCVGGDVYLKISDIRLIETSGHKNTIHLNKESFQIYKKLDDLAFQLKEYGFLRVHKSFLVNMKYIRKINNYVLTMEDGRQLPIPRAKYKQVRQEYALFVGKEL